MLLSEALKLRKERGLDPEAKIELIDAFSELPDVNLYNLINDSKVSSYAELEDALLEALSALSGGFKRSRVKPLKGSRVSSAFLDFFGEKRFELIKALRSLKKVKVSVPRGSGYIKLSLFNRFVIDFWDYSSNIAVASSRLADIIGLKANSVPIKIGGSFYRLYFSKDVKGPIFFDGKRASRETEGKIVSFGELILPIKACKEIYGVSCRQRRTFEEDLEEARSAGYLHPYYSFPKSALKLSYSDEGFIEASGPALSAMISSGIPFEVEGNRIRLLEPEEERSRAFLSVLSKRLGGISFFEPYQGSVKFFLRADGELPELNKYDAILPAEGVRMKKKLRLRVCKSCGNVTPFRICEKCGGRTSEAFYCERCGAYSESLTCPKCGSKTTEAYTEEIDSEESIKAASARLGTKPFGELRLPKAKLEELELPDKAALRLAKSLQASIYGIALFPVKLEAKGLEPNEVVLPSRLERAMKEVGELVKEELKLIYGENVESEEIGDRVVVFNKQMNAGVELKVAGFRDGNEALVNPSVIMFSSSGVLDNQAYVALSEDVALNSIFQGGSGVKIYSSIFGLSAPSVSLDYSRTPIYQQSLAEVIRGFVELLSKIYPDENNAKDSASAARKVEGLFVKQTFVCDKCGFKLRVPTLSMKCPVCGSTLRPRFTSSDLNKMVLQLNALAENFEGTKYRDLVEMYVENVRSIFKSTTQMSLGDFY